MRESVISLRKCLAFDPSSVSSHLSGPGPGDAEHGGARVHQGQPLAEGSPAAEGDGGVAAAAGPGGAEGERVLEAWCDIVASLHSEAEVYKLGDLKGQR